MEMKPISTLRKSLKSVDINTKQEKSAHKERSDVCAVPSASIIAEHMMSFAIADTLLDKFGGDSMIQFKKHLNISGKSVDDADFYQNDILIDSISVGRGGAPSIKNIRYV